MADVLQREGLLTPRTIFLGASSGSIVAAALASGLSARGCLEHTRACAGRVERRLLGPIGRMSGLVYQALDDMLPHDAHERSAGRFVASITKVSSRGITNSAHESPRSRRDLIELVLASCYIPLYYERPAVFRGTLCLDGGLTDNQPADADSLKVSPFPRRHGRARAHITPRVRPSFPAAFLPRDRTLVELFEHGRRDAESWLFAPLLGSPRVVSSPDEQPFARSESGVVIGAHGHAGRQ